MAEFTYRYCMYRYTIYRFAIGRGAHPPKQIKNPHLRAKNAHFYQKDSGKQHPKPGHGRMRGLFTGTAGIPRGLSRIGHAERTPLPKGSDNCCCFDFSAKRQTRDSETGSRSPPGTPGYGCDPKEEYPRERAEAGLQGRTDVRALHKRDVPRPSARHNRQEWENSIYRGCYRSL